VVELDRDAQAQVRPEPGTERGRDLDAEFPGVLNTDGFVPEPFPGLAVSAQEHPPVAPQQLPPLDAQVCPRQVVPVPPPPFAAQAGREPGQAPGLRIPLTPAAVPGDLAGSAAGRGRDPHRQHAGGCDEPGPHGGQCPHPEVVLVLGRPGRENKRRILVVVWLFVLSAIFWSGFEQAGSSMNLFAEKLTNRNVLGWQMPTSWPQNVNPIFIIILPPVFGYLWTWLAQRNKNPSIPMEFALGLLGLSAGFFVLAWGAAGATKEGSVAITWLVVTYFLHTVGELCLSPVGLSSITKLAPRDRISQMMGLWFVATALGNLFAGLTAGTLENQSAGDVFNSVAVYIGAAGLVAVAGAPFVKRVMGKIE